VSRVLVTGASGRLGDALVRALRVDGWTVRAFVHRRPVEGADETVRGDLVDGSGLPAALADVDVVAHLAAVTHARKASAYERVNVRGTANLLDAAERAGVPRFVHVSTRAVHPSGGAYSRSKASAEELVERSPLAHVIVRLPEVYGTGGEGVDDIIARARDGKLIFVVGAGSDEVCPISRDDAVSALVATVRAPGLEGRTYTLAGECTTTRELALRCVRAFGSGSRVVGVPAPLVAVAARLGRYVPLPIYPDQLDRLRAPKPQPSDEARADLGFAPCRLEDALARTAS
jgi:2-alkyl-3-oxoalkanoate reductase